MMLGTTVGMAERMATGAVNSDRLVANSVSPVTAPAAAPAVADSPAVTPADSGELAASQTVQAAEATPDFSGIDPTWIHIPAIEVNTHVIQLGLNADGTLQVPESYNFV